MGKTLAERLVGPLRRRLGRDADPAKVRALLAKSRTTNDPEGLKRYNEAHYRQWANPSAFGSFDEDETNPKSRAGERLDLHFHLLWEAMAKEHAKLTKDDDLYAFGQWLLGDGVRVRDLNGLDALSAPDWFKHRAQEYRKVLLDGNLGSLGLGGGRTPRG